MKRFLSSVFLAGILLASAPLYAATYKVDVDHTTVSFKIKHLFSNTQGFFRVFSGTLDYEPGKPDTWKASGTIDVSSIDTNVAGRDNHLRSADFFDAEKYPTITFQTTQVLESTDGSAKMEGLINIHGVEKPIILDVEIHGVAQDPWGNTRSGFTVTTKINRKDFGLTWNKALETGQLLVGEDVSITIELEGIQSTE